MKGFSRNAGRVERPPARRAPSAPDLSLTCERMAKGVQRRYLSKRSLRAVGFALGFAIEFSLVTLTMVPAQAQTYSILYNKFGKGKGKDGDQPAGLVQDSEGSFYGTTASGGAYNNGTVFKLSAKGVLKLLYTFKVSPDGASPQAGLVLDPRNGNLYGTTELGGKYGVGTVFEVNASGIETVLYNFGAGTDGAYPVAGLIMDSNGNLYGTTEKGGVYNNGTAFKLDNTGATEIWLYSFAGYPTDGEYPTAPLVLDNTGNLYGTTQEGGAQNNGTVFRLDPTGGETPLYSFKGSQNGDGASPYAGLVLDAVGNLYGTTAAGGDQGNFGTVFEVDTAGTGETVLYTFAGEPDGAYPEADLAMDAEGNLYGTTISGGTYNNGSVFELGSTYSEKVLHSFAGNPTDGQSPTELLLDTTGNLYGVTRFGGLYGCCKGVVFEVKF